MENLKPITTVDVVLLTLIRGELNVVLLKRDNGPFAGRLALPGGYIHADEDEDSFAAARRVLISKTGINSPYLEQLYTFSGPDRDPRGWSISITHYALVSSDVLDKRSADVHIVPACEVPTLAFDHNEIVSFAVKRVASKAEYSTLPCYLLPRRFTLTELQQTYEQVMGVKLDKKNFRRKVKEWDFIEEIPEAFKSDSHRPAQLYRIKRGKKIELFSRSV